MKHLAILAVLSLSVTGCGYKKWARPVGDFSTSTAPALARLSQLRADCSDFCRSRGDNSCS
jgi:hypothetical protein